MTSGQRDVAVQQLLGKHSRYISAFFCCLSAGFVLPLSFNPELLFSGKTQTNGAGGDEGRDCRSLGEGKGRERRLERYLDPFL